MPLHKSMVTQKLELCVQLWNQPLKRVLSKLERCKKGKYRRWIKDLEKLHVEELQHLGPFKLKQKWEREDIITVQESKDNVVTEQFSTSVTFEVEVTRWT